MFPTSKYSQRKSSLRFYRIVTIGRICCQIIVGLIAHQLHNVNGKEFLMFHIIYASSLGSDPSKPYALMLQFTYCCLQRVLTQTLP